MVTNIIVSCLLDQSTKLQNAGTALVLNFAIANVSIYLNIAVYVRIQYITLFISCISTHFLSVMKTLALNAPVL